MALDKVFKREGLERDYCDTDYRICNKELPPEFVHENIGGFKLEHIINYAYIPAPKTYYFNCVKNNKTYEVKKAKGLGGTYLTEEDYIKMVNNEKHTVTRKIFKIRKGINVRIINQIFSINQNYKK